VGGVKHRCGLGPADLGPLTLGRGERAERERVERQLTGCQACTDDLQQLRPVVAMLSGAASSVELEPTSDQSGALATTPDGPLPPQALDRMLAAVDAERTGPRAWRLARRRRTRRSARSSWERFRSEFHSMEPSRGHSWFQPSVREESPAARRIQDQIRTVADSRFT